MNGQPTFTYRTIDGERVAVVEYPDGTMFTPIDWQGSQPQTVEEIQNYTWYRVDANDPANTYQWQQAIMLNGWPRTMA